MATYKDEHPVIALLFVLAMLLVGGYMDAQDAKLTEAAKVQVAANAR